MSKDNIVEFPIDKKNRHLIKRNEMEAKLTDVEEYLQFLTGMITEQLVFDGYNFKNNTLVCDLTVVINMLCGALCRVNNIPHFSHEILDAMSLELEKMIRQEDAEEFDE